MTALVESASIIAFFYRLLNGVISMNFAALRLLLKIILIFTARGSASAGLSASQK